VHAGPLARPEVADAINQWAAGKTGGRIQAIVPSPLPPDSGAVVVDVAALRIAWARAFDKARTRERPFQLPFGDPVEAPMMAQAGSFSWARFDQGEAVAAPLAGGRLSLLVLLPGRGVDLAALVAGLGAERLEAIASSLKPAEGELALPRFTVECGKDLEGALQVLGMAPAFEAGADFSAMARGPARLGHVYHRVLVELSEEGGQTAEASAPPGRRAPVPALEHFEIVADRPFVAAVRDAETGALLLVGILADPRG
jgi:serpin B